MYDEKTIIEEYNGIKIMIKWYEYQDRLYIDFSDTFNLLCYYEKEIFNQIKQMLITDLKKENAFSQEEYNELKM